ncbi:response regulator [Botrimarina hoheduenensis]|uniref:Hydrogenase transcriptional regulatory protein hupR1 n=1 Tax=Botrimarina hoheduenensis TaxID=2528000 RepID=A0A5C5VWY4_9BACT|nr:response regulator [Botrimarina hoheduenensis]TWT42900.1 Hydrogenase transcriptional regulatory protein hupR1 [Botrimarina hoheduenensis]
MPRLLFVDDEPNVLSGLRRMLRSHRSEWEMDFVASGADALRSLALQSAQVVISDMRMPGMDGAELLSRVRDLYPETVRIVLSGHSDQELTLRAVGPAHQYLAKPCDPDRLTAAIRSAMLLHDRVRSPKVRSIVASVDTLPTLPEIYLELVDEMASPNGSSETAGRIIARDLGLSAKILKLVNSSFFGLPVRVSDVPHAVALLGLGVIRPLVLSTGVFKQFEGCKLGGISLARLTAHSTQIAVKAKQIAADEYACMSADQASDVFLAGLLHDVGRLVLAQAYPSEYEALCQQSMTGSDDLSLLEESEFGASHAEIGGHLIQLWGLPAPLVEAVALHHAPLNASGVAFSSLTAVHVAEWAAGEAEADEAYLRSLQLSHQHTFWAPQEALTST